MTRPLARPVAIPGTCACGLRGQHRELRECVAYLRGRRALADVGEVMSLNIRRFPVELAERLRKKAEANHRTLRGEIILALTKWASQA